jgi:hypothetical protein
MKIKINDQVLKDQDLQNAIDYLAESITHRHHQKMVKRNIVVNVVDFTCKVLVILFLVKYAPDLMDSMWKRGFGE